MTVARRAPRFSPTALETFGECKRHYHYRYVLRPRVPELGSPHLAFGNSLHAALAHLFKLPLAERSYASAEKALRHFWSKQRAGAFLNDGEEAAWGQRALEDLRWFCGSHDLEIQPLAVERGVRAELANGCLLSGEPDRVDPALGGEAIEIIDYKSGRCRIDDGDLNRDLSARLYAVAAAATFRQTVFRVRFIYLDEHCERTWCPEAEDLEAAAQNLEEVTAEVCNTQHFEPEPGPLCRFCKFKQLCPASREASLEQLSEPSLVF